MDLKPCPFCGAPANIKPSTGEIVAWHKEDCFFVLLDEHEVDLTEEEIIEQFPKAWNRRVNDGSS